VLARYVQMATEAGVTQAVFPEGGLSRTGAMREPKLGLLSYIIDGFQPGQSRDVVFVPVAINYDRVMEDRNLIRAQSEGSRHFRFSLKPILRYLRRLIWSRLTGRAARHGIAAVSFGEPVSLSRFLADHDGSAEALGADLMGRIAHVMPVLPFPVMAHAMACGIRSKAALLPALKERFERALDQGAPVFLPKRDLSYTIEATLQSLKGRRIVQVQDDSILLTPEGEQLIAFYARSVTGVLGDFDGEIARRDGVAT
jgi:glycerol-3-phosphate O-acyltransferase